ncbi:hypothetical protein GCM10028832_07060 [Streptomyces sparsus]
MTGNRLGDRFDDEAGEGPLQGRAVDPGVDHFQPRIAASRTKVSPRTTAVEGSPGLGPALELLLPDAVELVAQSPDLVVGDWRRARPPRP